MRELLAEAPDAAELVRSDLHSAGGGFPLPRSVALVRVSRSRAFWLVALSFRPERCFGPDDVRLMALVRQLLINHWQLMRAREELEVLRRKPQ